MGLFLGSLRDLTNATSVDVSLVDTTGNQITTLSGNPPGTATLTTVASSASSVTLLAANANRKEFIIVNNSSKALFVAFAATASATAYTFQMGANSTFQGPMNGYTGVISGIWVTANGNALITELTP